MILTCPKCATSYTIDEAQLGPDGRNVRCQSCRATWFAKRPEEPIELMAPAPKSAPAREVKARELPKLYRQLMEDKKRLKALATQGMIWGGMTLVFIAILGVAYLMRVDIVKAFPSTAQAFASAGIEVDVTGLKWAPQQMKVAPGLKAGRFVVSVTAEVRNAKDKPAPLPPIRVSLVDAHGQEVSNSLIVLDDITVAPHASRSLSFDIPDPKNLASDVRLKWDLVAMKELREKGRLEKYYKQAAKREASEAEHGEAGHGESGAEGGHGSEHDAGAADTHAADTGGLHPAVGHEEAPPSESVHSEAPALKPAVEAHH